MQEKVKIHFIGIGNPIMSNLALAVSNRYKVSGSDERLTDAVRTQLSQAGIQVNKDGWHPESLQGVDFVIAGEAIQQENPEILKAEERGIKKLSFPQFIYEISQDKQRIIITAINKKSVVTRMIIHVLNFHKRKFDYFLTNPAPNLTTQIRLTEEAPLIIIEADESAYTQQNPTLKFLQFKHHIAVITDLTWDNFSTYPSVEEHVKQYEALADSTPKGGALIFTEEDDLVTVVCRKERDDVQRIEFKTPKVETKNDRTLLLTEDTKVPLQFSEKKNLNNLAGAKAVCNKIGITNTMFYEAIPSFKIG